MASNSYRPLAPRVTENDNRKNNKFVASDTIEPLNRVTRMKWLYNKVSSYSLEYEFSAPAREWLKQRIATEDVSSRSSRSPSIWWENSQAIRSKQILQSDSDESKSGYSTDTGKSLKSGNIILLTFEQVVSNPQLLTDFREFLDDAIGVSNIDFIEMVNAWHTDANEIGESKSKEYDACCYDHITSIITQFINRDTAGDNLINISEQTRSTLTDTLHALQKSGKSKFTHNSHTLSMFTDAINEAKSYTKENLWADFVQSDDYHVFCNNYTEAVERTNNAKLQASSSNSNAGYDYCRNVYLPNFTNIYPERAPSWNNTNKYQSITLNITQGRGPMTALKQANELYVVAGSGSYIIRTPTSPGQWNEVISLPVYSNSQYIFVTVGYSSKPVGFIVLPIADMLVASNGPHWFNLVTEDQPGKLALPTPNTASTGKNEICVEWCFKTEHHQSASDKHKMIYMDETSTGGFGDFIRGKVSKKKTRFTEDNFNLDLTYITPQVIAMGFPADGTEGMYRNPIKQVQKFFMLRHPHAYRIYNLCSERSYDPSKFEMNCCHFPFDDHNPPPFRLIKEFCEDARVFLEQSPQNVISVHCKAGKGRTGTMIAAYFVYLGMGTAQEALQLFGRLRTSNSKGVTIPSQIRYVHYFDHYCRLRRAGKPSPGKTTLFLEKIIVHALGNKYGELYFTIYQPNRMLESTTSVEEEHKPKYCSSRKAYYPSYNKNTDCHVWDLSSRVIDLCEDFRIELYGGASLSLAREKLFQCWLNTRFLQCEVIDGNICLTIPKMELDKACKDKHHKKYAQHMYLQLVFGNVATATRIKSTELEL